MIEILEDAAVLLCWILLVIVAYTLTSEYGKFKGWW
jgi:hypothetical protein